MDLRTQIDEKFKSSFKSKNTEEINTLKLIRNAINNKDIANRSEGKSEPISDQQILIVLQHLVKQRRDSIESFKAATRNDLINKEKKEIEIINQFLPKQLSRDEIKTIIEKFSSDNKISSIKDMRKIMEHLKSIHSGSIDIGVAANIAKELLNN